MGPAKPKSGRTPRSRAGCLTCKAKHRKCDETRPACLNCVRRGLECEGYFSGLKWSTKHQPAVEFETQRPSPQRKRSPSTALSPSQAPSRASEDTAVPPASHVSHDHAVRGDVGNVARDGDVTTVTDHPVRRGSLVEATVATPSIVTSELSQQGAPSIGSKTNRGRDSDQSVSLSREYLTDASSAFIINWFEQVCSKWSGFDSSVNQNRMMAADLWRTSATVAGALESMSASFIASRLPSMRRNAVQLMQKATNLVQSELWAVRSLPQLPVVPTGLLFSLFCLGTTVCWVDAKGLGIPFFREAKRILKRLDGQITPTTSSRDRELLQFFNRCMTYCEMMLAMVRDEEAAPTVANLELFPVAPRPDTSEEVISESIHPWTGISTLTCELFTESVQLCRKYRRSIRVTSGPFDLPSSSFQDFIDAQKLEERLLALDIVSNHNLDDTGDFATPATHLAEVAEAYRLSSLIHLYQTFPDLVSLRLPGRSLEVGDDAVLWQEWIIPLSLYLVKVLDRIPPTSGSRMMQPLLYISASTGLRSNVSAGSQGPAPNGPLHPGNLFYSSPVLEHVGIGIAITGNDPRGLDHVSQMDIDVGNARHFVMSRLGILESSLPPTPVVVAKDLVLALWRAYDNEIPGCFAVHWVDVMEGGDLRSLFG